VEYRLAYGHPEFYDIREAEKEIVVKEGPDCRTYPRSDYKAEIAPGGYTITKKVLDLDYCVCWKITHQLREEYIKVKFIELSSHPIIIDFMEKRKQFLELLGIKD
jgi:hypothetical protein